MACLEDLLARGRLAGCDELLATLDELAKDKVWARVLNSLQRKPKFVLVGRQPFCVRASKEWLGERASPRFSPHSAHHARLVPCMTCCLQGDSRQRRAWWEDALSLLEEQAVFEESLRPSNPALGQRHPAYGQGEREERRGAASRKKTVSYRRTLGSGIPAQMFLTFRYQRKDANLPKMGDAALYAPWHLALFLEGSCGHSLYASKPHCDAPVLLRCLPSLTDELAAACERAEQHTPSWLRVGRQHIVFIHELLIAFDERTWIYSARVLLAIAKGLGPRAPRPNRRRRLRLQNVILQ